MGTHAHLSVHESVNCKFSSIYAIFFKLIFLAIGQPWAKSAIVNNTELI
jgi:hypothetical protein